ncbi:hypothetical protein SAMD00019534_112110 [Acytostelium subglobosum LB1]|uniref:hypothetical protein n=1 Tax=Acytostelium subglobosum LB1 TaxID=1410327 RepID=UPI000645113F|nr:hypothetical protein SAMD00019534_112110 [Acytostelium subglobosum LB1]GAM28035.1 hypothetical protein SAMD00019534_112110 [Acytostelium subglobosum LB1]|eukprot:XP_012748994.1 hypothetical protein SAMD00019534_112110 [Acytostelium subglobosum LB1]
MKPTTSYYSSFFQKEVDEYKPLFDNLSKETPEYLLQNRCTCDDLVITFPMDQSQADSVHATWQRRLRVFSNSETLPSQTSQTQHVDAVIKLGDFNKFEAEQIALTRNYFSLIDNPKPKSGNTYYGGDFVPVITTGNHIPFILNGLVRQHYSQPISINEIMDRDRGGQLFTILGRFLKTNTDPTDYYGVTDSGRMSHNNYGTAHHSAVLLHYDQHDTPEVVLLRQYTPYSYNQDQEHLVIIHRHVPGSSEYSRDHFAFGTTEEAKAKFEQTYKELTNTDYVHYETAKIEPKPGYLSQYVHNLPLRNKIPSMRDICFTVLKEHYLIDKLSFLDKISQLPIDVLREFCHSCLADTRAVGDEIANYLLDHFSMGALYNEDTLEDLFPFQQRVESMFRRHCWMSKSSTWSMPQSIFKPPHNTNILLNVYDNINMFKIKHVPSTNIVMPQPANTVKPVGAPSIVDRETFLKNFAAVTSDRFNFTPDVWKNMVVIGGGMTTALTGETEGFESSDIDIVFYGLNDENDIQNKFTQLYNSLQDNDKYSICVGSSDITLCRHYPYRHIQISVVNHKGIQDILLGVDIEASCFAFDGNNVWTTHRGLMAMNYRANFATNYGHKIRGERLYQRRLLKYLPRGFAISYLPTPYILEKEKQLAPSIYGVGLELMLSAAKREDVRQRLERRTKKGSLPYGPNISKEDFERSVNENHNNYFDGYNYSDWPSIAKNANTDEMYVSWNYPDELPYIEYEFEQFEYHTSTYYLDSDDEDDVTDEEEEEVEMVDQ